MSTQPLVLVADDEPRITKLVSIALSEEGFRVVTANGGEDALAKAEEVRPDIVLLDIVMPDLDGIEVMRQLRERRPVPVILLTAKGSTADKAKGLDLGADDYVAKPFSSRELLARVRAQARRARGRSGPATGWIIAGPLAIDPGARRATLDGAELALTTYEFELLRVLAERAGRVLTREQLVDLVRGSADEAFDRSIDVHVSHLRRKLGDDPRSPRLLKTVRGVGYLLGTERG